MRFRAAWAVIVAAALERVEARTPRLPLLGGRGEGSPADHRGEVVVLGERA